MSGSVGHLDCCDDVRLYPAADMRFHPVALVENIAILRGIPSGETR
jgi:hypothetical protein